MSQTRTRHATEDGHHYASTSVMNSAQNNGRYSMSSSVDAESQRPSRHRSVSHHKEGAGGGEMAVAKRPTPTTTTVVTRSRSLSSRPAAVLPAVRYPSSTGPRSVRSATARHPSGSVGGPTRSVRSGATTAISSRSPSQKNSSSIKAGVVVETMSAPNPFCPNTRGICCLMVLVNLALILIALGFIIVLQLPDPAFVWNIGIIVLVFGFIAMFVSLMYCMCICEESQVQQRNQGQPELFWTHHWQKNITIPEIKSKDKAGAAYWEQDRFPEDDLSDTSSRDYPRLYLDSDYGQRTDRENDIETEHEIMPASSSTLDRKEGQQRIGG